MRVSNGGFLIVTVEFDCLEPGRVRAEFELGPEERMTIFVYRHSPG